jgi:hypothetical protein
MNNIILVLLSAIGLGSVLIGLNSDDNKNIRENFSGTPGMPQLKAIGERVVRQVPNKTGNMLGSSASMSSKPLEYSINYNPMAEIYNPKKIKEGFTENLYTPLSAPYNDQKEMLGSYSVTDMPFISKPGFQQSTPLTSPNIALPPMAKYKPTTLSNMGISPAYKNNCRTGSTVVENFQPPAAAGFMDNAVDVNNMNPGANYSAGNYAQVAMQKPCSAAQSIDSIPVGESMSFSETGNPEQVQVYENLMYTTIKPGRTCQTGVRDMIRGDLPVCPLPQMGWFNPSAKPTDLQTGALQFMGGNSETVDSFHNFVQSYGSTQAPYQVPSGQQTIPQAMLSMQTGNKALSAISFS